MFESKKRAFVFMLIAVTLGAIAVILFSSYMKETKASLGEFVTVQVAAQDIPAGSVIKSELLKTQEIPRKYMMDSLITSSQQLENKISVVPITEGSVLTTSVLRNNTFVKGDYRQVMLRAPLAVFDEQIDAYDKVDIVYSYDAKSTKEKEANGDSRITKVLLKDVTVNSVQKTGNEITAIGVLVSLNDSKSVVWALNYGKEVRLLKSGSSKDVGTDNSNTSSNVSSTASSPTANKEDTQASSKDKKIAEKAVEQSTSTKEKATNKASTDQIKKDAISKESSQKSKETSNTSSTDK